MKRGTIQKKQMADLIAAVKTEARFYAPVRAAGPRPDSVALTPVETADEIIYDYTNTALPAKLLFFPFSEKISTRDRDKVTDGTPSDEKMILFGVRPCDASSLENIDKVFIDRACTDPFYQARRANGLIIALACNELHARCFCPVVEGRPDGRAGADILARDQGEALLFEAVTGKGESFMRTHAALFREADEAAAVEVDTAALPELSMKDVDARLNAAFDKDIWKQAAERCLGCGACTYVCPTCHCFAIYDEGDEVKGRRIRVHDGCQYASFTHEASGHNPRPTFRERMRQRIMHKFCYTRENFGDIFCTGCGRCVEACPVNIDIRETLVKVLS